MNFPLPQKYIMILPQRSLNCLYAPDKANLWSLTGMSTFSSCLYGLMNRIYLIGHDRFT
jgi:hypothetical protein